MHDNTLTDDNREKLIQIADRYGQPLKFYNVEELCADKLAEIEEYFPQVKESHVSAATFYRFFIPHLLLPQGIEKVIYLDSDIIVNLDISELWQVEMRDHPLGAVPELDIGVPLKKECPLVRDNVVKEENYFNAGILLMNLKVLNNEKSNLLAGTKFISDHPQFPYFDQDILNYCFSTSYLKLPVKFDRFVGIARSENEGTISKNIYHFVDSKYNFIMNTNDLHNQLFMNYFIKTPWVDADTRAILSGITLTCKKNYSISVVVPMYNEEKHIGECLDSLLIQTFQDFEVIVVDDCSTDNSVKIVESYVQKFNGRLMLTKTEKNSGTDCFPRNIGVRLARGEYFQFLDADDVILANALETLYKAAILYDADVVYTSSCYYWDKPNNIYLYKDGTSRKMNWIQSDLTIDDPTTNLSRLLLEPGEGNLHAAWTKFVRRDFMLRNKIFFADLPLAGDFIGVIDIYCHARRFLRISTPLLFYRTFNDHSMSRKVRAPQEQYRHWFSSFIKFNEALHKLEKEHKVLAANPLYCFEASVKTFGWTLNQTYNARKELTRKEIYKILHSELDKSSSDSLAVLLPFLFSFIENENKNIKNRTGIINKLRKYITAKIFVLINKKMDEETIQILSVSDDNATFSKPEWWQRNGTCHVIDSYAGELEIVAKAVVEGKVQIRLGGPYVENPNDRSKHIPYWIDYTKLVVNDKVLFDKVTPAWNDRHYFYELNARADEEIKVQVEWLPHRDERINVSTLAPAIQTEPTIDKKFLPYLTARADIKLVPKTADCDLKIVSVSDNKADVLKPDWFQKGGIGYQIQSHNGNMKIVAKVTGEGQVKLWLLGLDIRRQDDKSKRIPYWIDYTKLTVNGEVIFNKLTPVWHDKPYRYDMDVKANEEIVIQTEWLPHRIDVLPPPPKEEPTIDKKFLPYLTARVDLQLTSKTEMGDFQIVSVSDDKAAVLKPAWFQKGGIGYQIQSHNGNMKIVAKVIGEGKIQLLLLGLDIRKPDDKSKRIPYWIDYNKLTVNGKVIFNKLTPVWHDKPYRYDMDVKANEEIVIQTEWLPHRIDVLPPPPKEEPTIDKKFLPYLTARVDLQLTSKTEMGDFQIVSVSDDKAAVLKPAWFQKGGIGYQIQSHNGNMKIVAKVIGEGKIQLLLLGLDIRRQDDKSKRIPYWIDYTKLIVNGKVIFDKLTPVWHDKPYRYKMDAKDGDEIIISVEWQPHRSDT